jgi:hypothetical protein
LVISREIPADYVCFYQNVPGAYLGLVTVLSIIFPIFPFVLITNVGFVISYVYLRFYQPHSADLNSSQPSGLRGDASPDFDFAYFFPPPARPILRQLFDQLYMLAIQFKLIRGFTQDEIAAAASVRSGVHTSLISRPMGGGSTLPGSARAEADRRRALALRALDQRLNNATGRAQGGASSGTAANTSATVESETAESVAAEAAGHTTSEEATKV